MYTIAVVDYMTIKERNVMPYMLLYLGEASLSI
jgi:hypothetical protein